MKLFQVTHSILFALLPIRGRDIKFSLSTLFWASSLCTHVSIMPFCITSLHLSSDLPIFRCPPTSMFSSLHLPLSFSEFPLHVIHHLGLASLIILVLFATPALALIPDLHNPLYSSSISTFSSLFFLLNPILPSSLHRFHSRAS